MRFWKALRISCVVACCLLILGCDSAESNTLASNSDDIVVTVAVTPYVTQSATATASPAPTATMVPTLPAPVTLTQPPTTAATAIPTQLPPTATVEPTAAVAVPPVTATTVAATDGNCLPLAEAQRVRSERVVVGEAWPRPMAWDQELYAGRGGNRLIHLGFDVEGNPAYLDLLLDVLDRHQVKTTMFIVGSWAEMYPKQIQEFDRRGHEFANHTWAHGNLRDFSAEQVVDSLAKTEQTVQRLTGRSTKPWLRPPFGSRSAESIAAATGAGWTTVIWSGSPEDWRTEFDEAAMCDMLLKTAYDGGILYAHTGRPEMPIVIERFIGTLEAEGFTFVPLSVLMHSDPTQFLRVRE